MEFLSPLTITAFIAAFIGDFVFLFALGALIPIIGLVILAIVLVFHYCAGLAMGVLTIPKLNGFLPKLAVVIGVILPLPTLTLSLIIGLLLQNEIVQTVAMVAVGAVTGGTGAVAIKGASMAAEGEAAVEAGEAGAAGGKGAKETPRRGTAGGEDESEESTGRGKRGTTGAEGDDENEIPPEALGEEEPPSDKLKRELFQQTPSGGTNEKDDGENEDDVDVDDENNVIDLGREREERARKNRAARNIPDSEKMAA